VADEPAAPAPAAPGHAAPIRIAHARPPHAAPPSEAPPVAPPVRPAVVAAAQPAKPKGAPSFGLGLLGAFLGVIVGTGLWLLVHTFIGAKSKFLILGVGFFAGLGARYLSRDEGSQQLGMIAAALTLMGVFGVQYYIAYQDMFGYDLSQVARNIVEMQVTEAKKVLAAMPNESDEEIRTYLATAYADEEEDEEEEAPPTSEKVDPKSITETDIRDFREHMLPRYKDLASGKIPAAESIKELEKEEEEFKESAGVKLWLVVQGFGVFKLGLLIASCGLAYRMSANA
jgi:hypothetical protein